MPKVTEPGDPIAKGYHIFAINIACELGVPAEQQAITYHYRPTAQVAGTWFPPAAGDTRGNLQGTRTLAQVATQDYALASGKVITGAEIAEALSIAGYGDILDAAIASDAAMRAPLSPPPAAPAE